MTSSNISKLSSVARLRREHLDEPALREYFETIWDDVLVPLANASRHPLNREDFVLAHLSETEPAMQWRFQGLFGFGGKLIVASDMKCSVSYYPEDSTASREGAQLLVNIALDEVHRLHVRKHLAAA